MIFELVILGTTVMAAGIRPNGDDYTQPLDEFNLVKLTDDAVIRGALDAPDGTVADFLNQFPGTQAPVASVHDPSSTIETPIFEQPPE